MPSDDYTSVPSTGKLKLKGTADGRIDKKKKKKRPRPEEEIASPTTAPPAATEFQDNSVMLRSLAEEDSAIIKTANRETSLVGSTVIQPDSGAGEQDPDLKASLQTDAERRFEEQRRKRLEERLKREGVKTHKQRVEELNRYLSGLSEHHDMPKIGPG